MRKGAGGVSVEGQDEREWTAVGEQAGAARAGETMWSGPYLKPGERVTVVPKSRLVGSEARERELVEIAAKERGHAARHLDRALKAEAREREIETEIEGFIERWNELLFELSALSKPTYDGEDSAELVKAIKDREAVLVEALKEVEAALEETAHSTSSRRVRMRALNALTKLRVALAGVVEAEPDGSER